MKSIYYITIIYILIALSSCQSQLNRRESEFSILPSGLKYKYLKKSTDTNKVQIGDFLELELFFTDEKDSLLFTSKDLKEPFKLQLTNPTLTSGSIEEGLAMMHIGDSMKFSVDAENFYLKSRKEVLPSYLKKGNQLIFNVKLVKILQKSEIQNVIDNRKKLEIDLLNDYIKSNNITIKPSPSGLYFIETRKGKGAEAVEGKTIVVHYNAYLIDGRKFDSSIDRQEPFEFQLGTNQVIAGLEEGIKQMRVGSRAQLIIPSALAYGDKGYGRLIPPYSTLIFEIEVIDVF